RAVGGELPGRPQVHAGQVADGAVVFGVTQPPQRDIARIAGPRARLGVQEGGHPCEQLLALRGSRVRLLFWRPFLRLKLLDHLSPGLDVLANLSQRREALQIEAAFLDLRRVAFEAVLFQERSDLSRISVGQRLPASGLVCSGSDRESNPSKDQDAS